MRAIGLILAALALSACGDPTPQQPSPQGDMGTSVKIVHLPDGTKCAVMDGPSKAAIDCDWGQP